MNRLQKKCIIATAGFHLLLLTLLLVGPAFFNHEPKQTNTQLLDVISANLVENALNQGVQGATPPPPQPQTQPQQIQPPTPEPPKPVPAPTMMDRLEKAFAPTPTPEPPKPKPAPKLSADDLKPAKRTPTKNQPTKTVDNSAANARAINSAIRNLKSNLSKGTVIDVPGTGTTSSSNYRDALASIYYDAWTVPDGVMNDEPNTIVRITVSADGTVINARIITSSGDKKVDESVQRALERVTSVPPLPDQSKVQQEFTISFNLETKRMSE